MEMRIEHNIVTRFENNFHWFSFVYILIYRKILKTKEEFHKAEGGIFYAHTRA